MTEALSYDDRDDDETPEPTPLRAIQAEVATEDLPDGSFDVPLGDTTVRVLHPNDWPSSANEDMQTGRFLAWSRKALASDEDVAVWEERDPTNREVEQVFVVIGEKTGTSRGNGSGPNRSSRRTARR